MRTSNALDVIKSTENEKDYLVYKVIGGIMDFRFFLGEHNAESTWLKLNLYMGRSIIPPFWSLGNHQSRHGYTNITFLENVITGYETNDLPLDVLWGDIDYMV